MESAKWLKRFTLSLYGCSAVGAVYFTIRLATGASAPPPDNPLPYVVSYAFLCLNACVFIMLMWNNIRDRQDRHRRIQGSRDSKFPDELSKAHRGESGMPLRSPVLAIDSVHPRRTAGA